MMSQKRFDQIWSGISSSARKVYEEVPHQTPMDYKRIAAAMMRSGTNMDIDIIRGCLKALVSVGLVNEGRDGFKREGIRKAQKKVVKDLGELKSAMQEPAAAPEPFQPANKVVIRGLPAAEIPGTPAPMLPPSRPVLPPLTLPPETKPMTPETVVDHIGNLSQRIIGASLRHKNDLLDLIHRQQQEMADLGKEVADAAIEVQAQFEAGAADLADLAKLRQLAALLQDLKPKS